MTKLSESKTLVEFKEVLIEQGYAKSRRDAERIVLAAISCRHLFAPTLAEAVNVKLAEMQALSKRLSL
jgi:hypothetical protein